MILPFVVYIISISTIFNFFDQYPQVSAVPNRRILNQQLTELHLLECDENEEVSTCRMEFTCRNKDEFVYEDEINNSCERGCQCQRGFVRENVEKNAKCIHEDKCCGDFERWNECGSVCPRNCENMDDMFGGDMINCVQSCKPGCECDDGYVRESNLPSAMCVPTFICDAIRCGENEVWNYCGVKKSCVRTCEEVRKEFMLGQLDDNFKIERMNKALIGCRFNDCSADCECKTG